MDTTSRLASIGLAAMVAVLVGGSAHAALTSAQQKCLDGYNNKLRLVGQQAGKDYRSCVKNAGKGTQPDPNNCVLTDLPGKIPGKVLKVCDLYTSGKCTGAEPIQQGCLPGSDALIDWSEDLVFEIFGSGATFNAAVVSPGKTDAKCIDKAYQRAEQLFTEKLKAFRSCKKNAMKSGAVTDEATLETACASNAQPFFIPDPAGKQAGKAAKLIGDVTSNCGTVSIPTRFPGDCSGSANAAALGACIENLVECKVCLALNEADGMTINCDLADDGLNNGSCGLSQHKCVLAANPASRILIHIAALPVPLTFGLAGSLDIGSGGTVASCGIQMLNPVTIPAIGVVCIQGSGGCANGVRECAGGAPLGVDVQSDGNAGACTSNAQCAATAASACPVGYTVSQSACTGYCSGGAGAACSTDAQCASLGQNACNGPDPIGINGNICQISCISTSAHGPSAPGNFQCQLGSNLTVESAAPCDGTDTTIVVGQTCIPVSNQRASSLISDANFAGGSFVPAPPNANDLLGIATPCATVDGSIVTGLRGVGAVNFFGSALGDLAVGIQATCL